MAPSSACSASKLCGGSRRRMSSAPGRRVTLVDSFSGSMAELLKEARGSLTTAKSWCGQEYLKAGDKSRRPWDGAHSAVDIRSLLGGQVIVAPAPGAGNPPNKSQPPRR